MKEIKIDTIRKDKERIAIIGLIVILLINITLNLTSTPTPKVEDEKEHLDFMLGNNH